MHTARLHITLDTQADADIICWLEAQDNKSQAVRAALRKSFAPGVTLAGIRQLLHEELRGLAVAATPGRDVDAQLGAELDRMF